MLSDYSEEQLLAELKRREKQKSRKLPELLPEADREIKEIIETTEWLLVRLKDQEFDEDDSWDLMRTCIDSLYGREGIDWFDKVYSEDY